MLNDLGARRSRSKEVAGRTPSASRLPLVARDRSFDDRLAACTGLHRLLGDKACRMGLENPICHSTTQHSP